MHHFLFYVYFVAIPWYHQVVARVLLHLCVNMKRCASLVLSWVLRTSVFFEVHMRDTLSEATREKKKKRKIAPFPIFFPGGMFHQSATLRLKHLNNTYNELGFLEPVHAATCTCDRGLHDFIEDEYQLSLRRDRL